MANRTFNMDGGRLRKKVRTLYAQVAVGAAGAVTLKKTVYSQAGFQGTSPSVTLEDAPTTGIGTAVGNGEGVRSVVRTGTGAWTLTLSDAYQQLLGVRVIQISNATGAVASGLGVGVVAGSTNVTTNTDVGSGGVIALVLSSAAGVPADPANGDLVTLEITLGDAIEP